LCHHGILNTIKKPTPISAHNAAHGILAIH
jgi:hypothetical protein